MVPMKVDFCITTDEHFYRMINALPETLMAIPS